MPDSTPMTRQYAQIKREHQDAILFFRLGDFYEMFKSDALEASRILGLTLTSRTGMPMCGIPYHAAKGYIGRLLRAGKKVAICEQTRMPEAGKGIADREVIEIITPGTVTEEDLLEKDSNNYLMAVGDCAGEIALAWVDLSTGQFSVATISRDSRAEGFRRELARLRPKELLIQESLLEEDRAISALLAERDSLVVNRYPDWSFDLDTSREKLQTLLGVANLRAFGLQERSSSLYACGVLIEYIEQTSRSLVPHIRGVQVEQDSDHVGMDEATLRNLELVTNLSDGGRRYTLLSVVDHTRSAMGARMLKRWLLAPLRDVTTIEERLDAVEALYHDQPLLSSLRELLAGFLDLERLAARVAMERAHAKDLVAIRKTVELALSAEELLSSSGARLTLAIDPTSLRRLKSVGALLESALLDEPSILMTEGNIIRRGFNNELDELHRVHQNSAAVLDDYLSEERQKTGIASLKIKYNRVIGHFIEVTKSNLDRVPPHFIRRQSLVGGERFTTERLAELENELNSASERIVELEKNLFMEVRQSVRDMLPALLEVSVKTARLDCLQSFAYAATLHAYVRPDIALGRTLSIRGGRHPVVEANLGAGQFIPNDVSLSAGSPSTSADDPSDNTGAPYFALITGPNMAGKSTYLRQSALIVLLAQVGSFVPAEEARIGLVDRIFCRVGASDNLARGQSTFLVEMNETAFILRSSTPDSLIIMDEVGRGTGTNDGLSIARAVCEYLLDRIRCRTLFATHYHELTDLKHDGLLNLSLGVSEQNGEIVFLKRVQPGPSSNSYGIHVAKLAGLPKEVIDRANELLELLASHSTADESAEIETSLQPDLFAAGVRPVEPRRTSAERNANAETDAAQKRMLEELADADVSALTPLAALNLIADWQERLKSKSARKSPRNNRL